MIVRAMSWEIKEGKSVVWMDAPWFGEPNWVIKWWAGELPIGPQQGQVRMDVEMPEAAALEAAKRIALAVDARRAVVAERAAAIKAIIQEVEGQHVPTPREPKRVTVNWKRRLLG